MNYTYDVNIIPDKKGLDEFCNEFMEIYPEYEITEKKEYSGSSYIVHFSDGENTVTAELDIEEYSCTLTAPVRLTRIHGLIRQKKKAAAGNRLKAFLYSVSDRNSRGGFHLKYIYIPLVMLVVYFIFFGLSFDYILLWVLLVPQCIISFIEESWGWVWLVPIIPAAILAPHSKSTFAAKAITMSVPVLGAALFCACAFKQGVGVLKYTIRSYIDFIFYTLPLFYIALIPYMAVDDLCEYRLEKITGLRYTVKENLLGSVYAVLGSVALLVVCNAVDISIDEQYTENLSRIEAAYNDYDLARDKLVSVKYIEPNRSNFISVAEYVLEHDYTDWSLCPDEELEDEWEAIFSEGVSCEVDYDKSEEKVVFYLLNNDSRVAVFPYRNWVLTVR